MAVATGVTVVPTTGVESLSPKGTDPWYGRDPGSAQWSVGDHDEPGPQLVPPVRLDLPPARRLIPADIRHRCLEQTLLIERVFRRDRLGVAQDLRLKGVLALGHVPELLKHRQVHIRLHVTQGARVAIPVPNASDIPRLVNEPDVGHTVRLQLGAHYQPTEPGPDDSDIDLDLSGLALDRCAVWINKKAGGLGGRQGLGGPDRFESLVALLAILPADPLEAPTWQDPATQSIESAF